MTFLPQVPLGLGVREVDNKCPSAPISPQLLGSVILYLLLLQGNPWASGEPSEVMGRVTAATE